MSNANQPVADASGGEHSALMDRVYRSQRHIYDMTRKYFLLGRDALLKRMEVEAGDHVVEIGCGTARNLIKLAKRVPDDVRFYGLDASAQMLITAEQKVASAGLADRCALTQCYAEQLDYERTFGLDEPFDVAFYSYTLSMIPTWPEALEASLRNLKPGKKLYIVDFWDQARLPGFFRAILTRWLALFHVYYRLELIEYLHKMNDDGRAKVTIEPLYRQYAFLAVLEKPAEGQAESSSSSSDEGG